MLRVWPMDPFWDFRSPLWGWGVGHRGQPLGLHYVVGRVGGLWAGLDGDGGRGVPHPWLGLAGCGGGLRGMDDGAIGDGDVDEALDGVVLGGRLRGGGGCRWEGGVGCGRWGVLAWVGVRVGAMSVGFVSLCLWCCRVPLILCSFLYFMRSTGWLTVKCLEIRESWYVAYMLAYAWVLQLTICRITWSLWHGTGGLTKLGLKFVS